MSLGQFLEQQLGLDPTYNKEMAQAQAIPQIQQVFAGLPAALGQAQNADMSFNQIAPNNQSGPGAVRTAYQSALSQLASIDPQTYGKEALTANDPNTVLDGMVKQATATNLQGTANEANAVALKDRLLEDPQGNTHLLNANGTTTKVFSNPFGPRPSAGSPLEGVYDMARMSSSPLGGAMLRSTLGGPQSTPTQTGGMSSPVSPAQSGAMSTPAQATGPTDPLPSTGNPILDKVAYSLASPSLQDQKKKFDADKQASAQDLQSAQQSNALFNSKIREMYSIAPDVSRGGPFGSDLIREGEAKLASSNPNSPTAQANAAWDQGNAGLQVAGIQNLVSGGGVGGRIDLPIAQAIKTSSAIPATLSPTQKQTVAEQLTAQSNNNYVTAQNKYNQYHGLPTQSLKSIPYEQVKSITDQANATNAKLAAQSNKPFVPATNLDTLDRLRDKGYIVQ